MTEAQIGLVGVVIGALIGFGLTVGHSEWTEWRLRKRVDAALASELAANLRIIPQKRDILRKMLDALSGCKILPGESVPFCSAIYGGHFQIVSAHMNINQRNSLHLIYSSLAMVDSSMKSCDEAIIGAYDSAGLKDIVQLWSGKLKDLLKVLDVTEAIIQKHLTGTPTDVLNMGLDYEKVKAARFVK
jgi:hypothetical protein